MRSIVLIKLLVGAALAADVPGSCEWFEHNPKFAYCDGGYDCHGVCGINCACAGGGVRSYCGATGSYNGPCDKGPGPTCMQAGKGRCDACDGYYQHHTQFGCSSCLSNQECEARHSGQSGRYPRFCYNETGDCGGECGGADGGDKFCKKKYGTQKPYCHNKPHEGAWCHECGVSNFAKFQHNSECDPGKDDEKRPTSKTPFCIEETNKCVSCKDVYEKYGKCPEDFFGSDRRPVCVLDKKKDKCYTYEEAPCSAFVSPYSCPIFDYHRAGGVCDRIPIPGSKIHLTKCGDAPASTAAAR